MESPSERAKPEASDAIKAAEKSAEPADLDSAAIRGGTTTTSGAVEQASTTSVDAPASPEATVSKVSEVSAVVTVIEGGESKVVSGTESKDAQRVEEVTVLTTAKEDKDVASTATETAKTDIPPAKEGTSLIVRRGFILLVR